MEFFVLLVLSFAVAWASRLAWRSEVPASGACNIRRNGRLTRVLIACALLGAGYAMSQPLLTLCGGFALYEAIMGWCVFVSLVKR